jgi:hypothetical protein
MFESVEAMSTKEQHKTGGNVAQAGGKRRRGRKGTRKARRGSRKARKGSKKRTAGNWIGHVKKYAKDNNMSFKDAMSSAACRSSYKKM